MSLWQALAELTVHRPIEQQVMSGKGFNELVLYQKKSMAVADYKALVDAGAIDLSKMTTAQIEAYVA